MARTIFKSVEMRKPRYNTFDLSHEKKLSFKMASLIPTMLMAVNPGEKFTINQSILVRLMPMIAPVMHRINVFTHFFFVPNRLLYKNWEPFITGGEDGQDQSVFPQMVVTQDIGKQSSLADYLGLPTIIGNTSEPRVSPLPFLAYQFIYDEYYRDQNLQTKVLDGLTEFPVQDGTLSGADATTISTMRTRAWQHDYFTSALPWTQKGPEALVPLGDWAPVNEHFTGDAGIIRKTTDGTEFTQSWNINVDNDSDLNVETTPGQGTDTKAYYDPNGTLRVDLSSATASSINDLRRAFRLQEWLEKNARGGSRYIESIYIHFGVYPQDSRLQRPEFLGGSINPVQISEVLQTSETDAANTPQGNMSGHGIVAGGSRNIGYTAKEHGYIIGITSVLPVTAYYQGIPKDWTKTDKFEWYWRQFANLGEQAIDTTELYYDAGSLNNGGLFGYTPRYAEYKFIQNSVHGEFKGSLDYWHMARNFANKPVLNEEFISSDPEDDNLTRIFALYTSDNDTLWSYVKNNVKAKRQMPIFGTPTI